VATVCAWSTFERPAADVGDPVAADFDRLSACPDRLPPYDRKSLHHQDTEHYKRNSLREHDGVGDAVRAGAGEQRENAALLAIEARFRHRGVLTGRCVGVLLEAASVWMMFVTAYGLIEDAKVTKGDFVLIPAASSSVGVAAIQVANYTGATTIALTRTSAKKRQLLDAGAAHVIATEEVDLVGEVMRITNGQGARVAFDPVGGPGFPKLISALAFGGIIYIYGLLGTGVTPLPVLEMIAKVATIKAHNMSLTSGDETRRKAAIEFVTQGLQAGALKPVIDRTFTFDEMADVHRYLEQGGQFGKIVVTV